MSFLESTKKIRSKEQLTDVVKLWKKRKDNENKDELLQFLNEELTYLHFMTPAERIEFIEGTIKYDRHSYDDHVIFLKTFLEIEPLA